MSEELQIQRPILPRMPPKIDGIFTQRGLEVAADKNDAVQTRKDAALYVIKKWAEALCLHDNLTQQERSEALYDLRALLYACQKENDLEKEDSKKGFLSKLLRKISQ